jgi:hypothetical protein
MEKELLVVPGYLYQSIFIVNDVMKNFYDKYPGTVFFETLILAVKRNIKKTLFFK